MTPEDRDALIEAAYNPDDPDVQDRMIAVERGLKLLRQRWHSQPRDIGRYSQRGASTDMTPQQPTH